MAAEHLGARVPGREQVLWIGEGGGGGGGVGVGGGGAVAAAGTAFGDDVGDEEVVFEQMATN